jgi:hypothetical protein
MPDQTHPNPKTPNPKKLNYIDTVRSYYYPSSVFLHWARGSDVHPGFVFALREPKHEKTTPQIFSENDHRMPPYYDIIWRSVDTDDRPRSATCWSTSTTGRPGGTIGGPHP